MVNNEVNSAICYLSSLSSPTRRIPASTWKDGEKGEALVRTGDPIRYWRCVGHIPETFFAFPQRLLGTLSLNDLLDHRAKLLHRLLKQLLRRL
jgi:hypothetical protein